jgi:hypothetical protein
LKSFGVLRCLKSYQPSKHIARKRISSEAYLPKLVPEIQVPQPTPP